MKHVVYILNPEHNMRFDNRSFEMLDQHSSLGNKRCMSMPSVTSSSASSTKSSRSRLLRLQDRRFHEKFPDVESEEHLINYFSCAFVGDILLQGHLFVTEHFFAFYSSIFGHKTELLIPVSHVIKVTKERTAKIIPNAVGVHTKEGKYIFGSLLSRDTAYRVIQQTWKKHTDAACSDEDSLSGVSSQLTTSDDVSAVVTETASVAASEASSKLLLHSRQPSSEDQSPPSYINKHRVIATAKQHRTSYKNDCINKVEETIFTLSKLSQTSILILVSTALLVILLLSASVLLYRISLVHKRLTVQDTSPVLSRYETQQNLKQEADAVQIAKNLQERIRHLVQIRQSLEELQLTAYQLQSVCKISLNVPVITNIHQHRTDLNLPVP